MSHEALAKKTQVADETPVARRQRVAAARELDTAERKEREAQELAKRLETMPRVLFNLLAQVTKLSQAGLDVDAEFVGCATERETYNSSEAGYPGVRLTFGGQAARRKHDDDGYRDTDVVTVASEEWRLDVVRGKLEGLQAEYDEKQRMKALAQEAKAKLTPEELAALKQYG